LEFGNKGAFIIGIDKNKAHLDEFKTIMFESNISYELRSLDITNSPACIEFCEYVISHYGGLDVLINNAGITHIASISLTNIERMREVLEVNYWGAVSLTKNLLNSLIIHQGSIIVINSVTGYSPLIGRGAYVSSKHALHGFFETLRAEVGKSVDVLAVYPDFVDTNIRAKEVISVRKSISPTKIARRIRIAWRWKRRRLHPTVRSYFINWMALRHPNIYVKLMKKRVTT